MNIEEFEIKDKKLEELYKISSELNKIEGYLHSDGFTLGAVKESVIEIKKTLETESCSLKSQIDRIEGNTSRVVEELGRRTIMIKEVLHEIKNFIIVIIISLSVLLVIEIIGLVRHW